MAPGRLPTAWSKSEAYCESQTAPDCDLDYSSDGQSHRSYRVIQSPNYEMYRAVDVVQLVGSGVCFGAAMVGVILGQAERDPDNYNADYQSLC